MEFALITCSFSFNEVYSIFSIDTILKFILWALSSFSWHFILASRCTTLIAVHQSTSCPITLVSGWYFLHQMMATPSPGILPSTIPVLRPVVDSSAPWKSITITIHYALPPPFCHKLYGTALSDMYFNYIRIATDALHLKYTDNPCALYIHCYPSRTMHHATKCTKTSCEQRNILYALLKSSTCWPGLQILQIPIWLDGWGASSIHGSPTLQSTINNPGCRNHQ